MLARVPEFAEEFAGSGAIGRMGLFGCGERSQMCPAAYPNAGLETPISGGPNALREIAGSALVPNVLCVSSGAEIAPAVVISDSVDVVNLRWFVAGDHFENDAVCGPQDCIDLDQRIACMVIVSCDVSGMSGVPSLPFPIAGKVVSRAPVPPQRSGPWPIGETGLEIIPFRKVPHGVRFS